MDRATDAIAEDEFVARLRAALERLPLPEPDAAFAVALSGGVDSTVLAAAMRRLVPESRLIALHIDHGLHPDSARWVEHCRRTAAALGLRFEARRVAVERDAPQGLEAAAREARYAALEALLAPGQVLLTAHHGDDQLETTLLRMLRGAGVRGMTGIREFAVLGKGFLARPLLEFTRAEITAQAVRWGLAWVDDPANLEPRFDRSFLRERVLPALRERWPAAQRAAVRLAHQMAEAEQLLEEIAARDAAAIVDRERIPCDLLRGLRPARRTNLLRHLIRGLGLPVPDSAQLRELEAALAAAHTGARVAWPGVEARIYRERLYLQRRMPASASASATAGVLTLAAEWRGAQGRMRLEATSDAGFPDAWARAGLEIRFRAGGERFKPAHAAHSKTLKHWFQENGIVPWMRDRIPLLYRDGVLVGIADLSIGEEARVAATGGPRWRAVWTEHPPVQ